MLWLAIFGCLLLVVIAILAGVSGYWLVGPLAIVGVLVLGLVQGVQQDVAAVRRYLTEMASH